MRNDPRFTARLVATSLLAMACTSAARHDTSSLTSTPVDIARPSHAASLYFGQVSHAHLDTSFGRGGKVITDPTSREDGASAIAIQEDGKMIVAGGSGPAFGLVRYRVDGTLDPTFGGDGTVTTDLSDHDDRASAVAIQADGKIIAAGHAGVTLHSAFAVVRYESDGTLDTTFGEGGVVTTGFGRGASDARALVLQPDGRIVAVGFSGIYTGGGQDNDFALARYEPDGTPDPTFGNGGKVQTHLGDRSAGADEALGAAIQTDGKIVAAGWASLVDRGVRRDMALARYNPDGTLDPTFGGDGTVTFGDYNVDDVANAVAIQPDGKILVAGKSGMQFALARYNEDGSLDADFGHGGTVRTVLTMGPGNTAFGVAIQTDGAIVAVGNDGRGGCRPCGSSFTTMFAAARYTPDGSLDGTFGALTDFTARDDIAFGVAIQPDGKVVLAGEAGIGGGDPTFALARYLPA